MSCEVLKENFANHQKYQRDCQAFHESLEIIIKDEFLKEAGSIYSSLQQLKKIIVSAVYVRCKRHTPF